MITGQMVEAADKQLNREINADWLPGNYDSKKVAKAVLEAAERSAWQPIETAPKDGTIIDVWLGDAEQTDIDFYCPDGSRRSTDWRWQSGKFRPALGLSIAVTLAQPTHWRPIPAPLVSGAVDIPVANCP